MRSIFPGYGVFAKKKYAKGDFLMEYRGEMVSSKEGREKMESYPKHLGSYLFFYDKYW